MQPVNNVTDRGQLCRVNKKANVLLTFCVKLAGPCHMCFAV